MKKLVVILLSVFAFVACSKDDGGAAGKEPMLGDVAPVTIQVRVQSTDGVDLLNPKNNGYIPNQGVTLLYGDEVYELQDGASINYYVGNKTRALSYSFKGITREILATSGEDYYLEIGEWNPMASIPYTTMIIQWADGSQDEVGLLCNMDKNPVERTYFLNGKIVEDAKTTIGQIVIHK